MTTSPRGGVKALVVRPLKKHLFLFAASLRKRAQKKCLIRPLGPSPLAAQAYTFVNEHAPWIFSLLGPHKAEIIYICMLGNIFEKFFFMVLNFFCKLYRFVRLSLQLLQPPCMINIQTYYARGRCKKERTDGLHGYYTWMKNPLLVSELKQGHAHV